MSVGVPPVCECAEGAYIGTQRAGAPVCCERCGRITLEQLTAIRRPVDDEVQRLREKLIRFRRKYGQDVMGARYEVTIYQSNWHENRVTVEVVASSADEAKRKALALAPRIHDPLVTFGPIREQSE